MTGIPNDRLVATDSGRLGTSFRWIASTGTVVLVASIFLGLLGLVTVRYGAAAAFAGLLVGMRWFDRQPRLGAVPPLDWVLLALVVAGTFAVSQNLLLSPSFYWIYWMGLGLLLLNATVFIRVRDRRIWISAAVFLVFFVAAVFVVRSSAVVRAVEAGSTGHARLFLWFGADANLRKQHDPLLVMALRAGDLATARLLLDHGADPNGKTSDFMARTPALSEAAALGRTDLVELLLDRGADPNLRNSWGETPLGRAARAGQARAVRVLLSRGADPNLEDHDGHRPIDAARQRHHTEVERLLAP